MRSIKTGSFENIRGRQHFIPANPSEFIDDIVISDDFLNWIKSYDNMPSRVITCNSDRNDALLDEANNSCLIEKIEDDILKDRLYEELYYRYLQDPKEINDEITVSKIIDSFKGLDPSFPEKFRDHNVRIGKCFPPDFSRVPYLMEEFVKFCNTPYKEPLIKIALAHAYFESIHPFHDGNGRLGRIIILWMLKNEGFLDLFFPSEFFLNNLDGYYNTLNEYILNNQAQHFVEFFLGSLYKKVKFIDGTSKEEVKDEQVDIV